MDNDTLTGQGKLAGLARTRSSALLARPPEPTPAHTMHILLPPGAGASQESCAGEAGGPQAVSQRVSFPRLHTPRPGREMLGDVGRHAGVAQRVRQKARRVLERRKMDTHRHPGTVEAFSGERNGICVRRSETIPPAGPTPGSLA